MSPAEAGAVELDEPHWKERFEYHCARWPNLPRYLAEDSAFEATLSEYRRFHSTPIEVNGEMKRLPASSIAGQIGLARLNLFPPRFIHADIPRTQETGFQSDDHMWLSIASEQWRILAIEDRMLILEKGFEDKPEQKQIDLSRVKWDKYIEAATAVLEAMKGDS